VEALLHRFRSCGKGMTAWKTKATSCPENSKTSPEVEAADLEETSGATEAVMERQELRMEEAYVDAVGSLEDRHKGQCLKVRRRRQPRKQIQDSVGSRVKLAAARRRKISRAVPAVRKGHVRMGQCKMVLQGVLLREEGSRRDDAGQKLQEAHASVDGGSSSSVYDLNTRCELLVILEGPATSQELRRA
jgi:hypothetical protein